MKGLQVTADYRDPSLESFEVVERKGVGHPIKGSGTFMIHSEHG